MRWQRKQRARRSAAAALLAALGVLALCTPIALAKHSPSLSWTLPHAVNEGSPITFSWRASHLGWKHRLVVQRQEGTAHSWRTIMRLSASRGSAELPGLPLGTYRLRLADLGARRRLLSEQVAGIGVFGQVPFTTLLQGQPSGVYTTPTNTFTYVMKWDYFPDGGFGAGPAVTDPHNHCQSVHIDFVTGPLDSSSEPFGASESLSVVQETLDPVTASALFNTPGSLNARLVPGKSWSIDFPATGDSERLTFYLNGSAMCDSTASFNS